MRKIVQAYLRGESRRGVLALSTWLAVLGIALGVGAVCLVMSVFDGFMVTLSKAVVDKMGHFIIYSRESGESEQDFEQTVGPLLPPSAIREPFGWVDGAMAATADGGRAVSLEGLTPAGVQAIEKFRLHPGDPVLNGEDVWVGETLAQDLNLKVGDSFQVIVPSATQHDGIFHRSARFKVANIIALGMHDYDGKIIVCSLDRLMGWLDWSHAPAIRIRLTDGSYVSTLARLNESLEFPWRFRSWEQLHRNFFQSIAYEKLTLTIVVALIILLSLMNVSSTLYLLASEKVKDVSILKAMGATKRQASQVFLLQGMVLGALGAMIGIALALGMVFVVQRVPLIDLPRDVYNLSRLPVSIHPGEWALVALGTVVCAVAAASFPAARVRKLNPVEGIRYE